MQAKPRAVLSGCRRARKEVAAGKLRGARVVKQYHPKGGSSTYLRN